MHLGIPEVVMDAHWSGEAYCVTNRSTRAGDCGYRFERPLIPPARRRRLTRRRFSSAGRDAKPRNVCWLAWEGPMTLVTLPGHRRPAYGGGRDDQSLDIPLRARRPARRSLARGESGAA